MNTSQNISIDNSYHIIWWFRRKVITFFLHPMIGSLCDHPASPLQSLPTWRWWGSARYEDDHHLLQESQRDRPCQGYPVASTDLQRWSVLIARVGEDDGQVLLLVTHLAPPQESESAWVDYLVNISRYQEVIILERPCHLDPVLDCLYTNICLNIFLIPEFYV